MLPIRVTTSRYSGGFKVADFIGGRMLVQQSDERENITLDSVDLENPVGIRLANCRTMEDLIAFCNRFSDDSFSSVFKSGGPAPVASIEMREAWSVALGSAPSMEAVKRSGVNAHLGRIARSMKMPAPGVPVEPEAAIRPQIRFVDGRPRLTLETNVMAGFMMLELAAAIEAGVTAVTCDHCDKLFLIGPFTGRRSHARFCSDRCRVAAMRARNAAKGPPQ